MINTVKCKRCEQIMISEEFSGHRCSPPTRGYKSLMIDFYVIGKDDKNREMLMVKGMDGIMYTLVVKEKSEHDAMPYLPTAAEQPDRNNRKGNRTPPRMLLGSTVFGHRCSELVGTKFVRHRTIYHEYFYRGQFELALAISLITQEAHEKFMAEIRQNIDAADKSTKQKAETVLKTISDNYRDKIVAALANAKEMEAKARKAGYIQEAERHKLAAEIYQSLLDSLGLGK